MNSTIQNFLPEQYQKTGALEINHNYLHQQFFDHDEILSKIRNVVINGDFTLGKEVDLLEKEYAEICGAQHAIGVGSGTDALFLSLKAIDIDKGDEVITTPFTFYATVGAIVTSGAKPVFVDAGDDYNINPDLIERAITPRTKAIMPVYWSGKPCDLDAIENIASKYNLAIIADACHGILATYKGKKIGGLGTTACYSFHPLKNLNVWGDGGIITTNSIEIANKLRLLRNHGLISRDECQVFGYNSRLDTIQAVVARHMLQKIEFITQTRVSNASVLDEKLKNIHQIKIPRRETNIFQVYHLYMVLCEQRDELQKYLIQHGVDAKIHYPIPLHLQPAARSLGYKIGDFPVAENISKNTLSIPVHEFITLEQLNKISDLIGKFYEK
ncbi:MAG: DegT/DnrJ/EryC1/StrS family aminotransferase [Alphaproteobacteria bacterium]